MPLLWLVLIILAIGAAGFVAARLRVLSGVDGDRRRLHSLPGYYGWFAFLAATGPALIAVAIWSTAAPLAIEARIAADLPQEAIADGASRSLLMSEVRRVSDGLSAAVGTGALGADAAADRNADAAEITETLKAAGQFLTSDVTPVVLTAAQDLRAALATSRLWLSGLALALALGGLAFALTRVSAEFRARNRVETAVRWALVAASTIAIVTTLGIVLSLLFNTIAFFRVYPASEFFGSLTWQPSFGGGSSLGIWPLLWGTFYISIIALLVAVPIGLYSAIYLSEYASGRMRAVVKPLIEVLAGIPTIVYGLFALLTVGPMLMRVFGADGLGWMQSGTAVMTAGLVMGIMLIPFVSSLSDDIINAVPQSLRDGSYAIGATQSETIRQVILPAALPGIVGAILLAASRAIGETMIVVLGAGAAARLSLNPFEAMTTVTAKIVSQLTGDADFASPEALVAFALGMTLFVLTLGLNVFALYIVRKYREQYE